ncbi:BEN domain-containing protein 5 [Holothuria leucospilota]|uniref:BEN domain-containing protein 5 n=1 Tax=Holothuria leucospilota TaxID=206669 RepID=A0A9Q1C4E8_HOLLE|nr:BEN domain-containing protein 5 [Holothuria leucospilota]
MVKAVRFVYVRYLKDNEKDIVPISYFKNGFKAKDVEDFDSHKVHMVQWRGDIQGSNSTDEEVHYKAQILMLGDSKEGLEKKKDNSRVRIPKVLDTSVEDTSSDDDVLTVQKESTSSRKEKKQDQNKAKQKSLRAIMLENVEKRKSLPLLSRQENSGEKMKSPSACTCEAGSQLQAAKKRYREAEAQKTELERQLKKLKTEADKYQQLNKDLQVQLLKKLKGNSQESSAFGRKVPPSPQHSEESGSETIPRPQSGEQKRQIQELLVDDDTSTPKYVEKDGMVSIGGGISLTKEQWDALECQSRHSLFVKALAVATWGTDVLKDRSVGGNACNRFKDQQQARAPLSPHKLRAVKDCFMDRLTRLNVSQEERNLENSKFKKYIAEKIQDINRLLRRQAKE